MWADNKVLLGAVAVVTVLVLLGMPSRCSTPMKGAVRTGTMPAEGLVTGFSHRLHEALSALRGLSGMVEKNLELSEEVVRLQASARAFESLERENNILRKQLHFFRESSFEMIPCEVIARGISGWWKTIRISKGTRHGVQPERAVVSPDGLVGKTVEADPFTSEVLLLSDPACKLSARISRTGSFGIVSGAGLDARGNPECRMEFINKDVPVRVGDEVVTSGLGGVFPEGILIGYIESVAKDELGLYQESLLIPKADLGIIEYVFAVTEEVVREDPMVIEEEATAVDRVLREQQEGQAQ
ncbi:rod shape-determining protein MreC [Verrucomicrobiota bacterium]